MTNDEVRTDVRGILVNDDNETLCDIFITNQTNNSQSAVFNIDVFTKVATYKEAKGQFDEVLKRIQNINNISNILEFEIDAHLNPIHLDQVIHVEFQGKTRYLTCVGVKIAMCQLQFCEAFLFHEDEVNISDHGIMIGNATYQHSDYLVRTTDDVLYYQVCQETYLSKEGISDLPDSLPGSNLTNIYSNIESSTQFNTAVRFGCLSVKEIRFGATFSFSISIASLLFFLMECIYGAILTKLPLPLLF